MIKVIKYKLYAHDRNNRLHHQIHLAATIYNHCLALHRCYYRWYGQSLDLFKLQKHITKLKKRTPYLHWKTLNSQVIQDTAERIDKAYKLFFRNLKHGIKTAPPRFKKSRKYHSITFKQSGWGLAANNQIRISKDLFKFSESRPIEGTIKTVTVKRDALNELYCAVEVEVPMKRSRAKTAHGIVLIAERIMTATEKRLSIS